jgi:hypothetical protein
MIYYNFFDGDIKVQLKASQKVGRKTFLELLLELQRFKTYQQVAQPNKIFASHTKESFRLQTTKVHKGCWLLQHNLS